MTILHLSCPLCPPSGSTGSIFSNPSSDDEDDSVFDDDYDELSSDTGDVDDISKSLPHGPVYPVKKTALFYFDEDGDITTGDEGRETQLTTGTSSSQLKRKNDTARASSGYNTEDDREDRERRSKIPKTNLDEIERDTDRPSSDSKEKKCWEEGVENNADALQAPLPDFSTLSPKIKEELTPPIVVELWDSPNPSCDPCGENQKASGNHLDLFEPNQGFSREEREPTPFLPGPPGKSRVVGASNLSPEAAGVTLVPPPVQPAVRFEREATPTPELGRKTYKAHVHTEPKETSFQREATPFLTDADHDTNKRSGHKPPPLTLNIPHLHTRPDLLGARPTARHLSDTRTVVNNEMDVPRIAPQPAAPSPSHKSDLCQVMPEVADIPPSPHTETVAGSVKSLVKPDAAFLPVDGMADGGKNNTSQKFRDVVSHNNPSKYLVKEKSNKFEINGKSSAMPESGDRRSNCSSSELCVQGKKPTQADPPQDCAISIGMVSADLAWQNENVKFCEENIAGIIKNSSEEPEKSVSLPNTAVSQQEMTDPLALTSSSALHGEQAKTSPDIVSRSEARTSLSQSQPVVKPNQRGKNQLNTSSTSPNPAMTNVLDNTSHHLEPFLTPKRSTSTSSSGLDKENSLRTAQTYPVIPSRPPLDTSLESQASQLLKISPAPQGSGQRSFRKLSDICSADTGDSSASESGNSRSSSARESTSAPDVDTKHSEGGLSGQRSSDLGSGLTDRLTQGLTVFMSVIEWVVLPPLPAPPDTSNPPAPASSHHSDHSSSSEPSATYNTSSNRREARGASDKKKLKLRGPRFPRRRQSRAKSSAQKTGTGNSRQTLKERLSECSPFGRHTSVAVLFIILMTFICLTLKIPIGEFVCYVLACFYTFCVLRHLGMLD